MKDGNIDTSSQDRGGEKCLDKTCTTCRELDSLDDVIAAAKSRLQGLMKTRNSLQATVDNLHKTIFGRFPYELVVRVFELVVLDDDPHNIRAYRRARLRLGAIASSWRKMAWTTPSLWTTLPLDIGHHTRKDHHRLAREWRDRSAPHSLRFVVDFSAVGIVSDETAFPYVDLINRTCHRWSKLDLFYWTPGMLSRLSVPSDLSTLRLVLAKVTKTMLQGAHVHTPYLFSHLSSGCWKQVTHMDIDGILMRGLLLLPAQAKQLKTLRVKVRADPQLLSPMVQKTPDVHKNLTVLCIEAMQSRHLDLGELFHNNELPALEKFKLKIHIGDLPTDSLLQLFATSRRLKKLRIHVTSAEAEDLIELARSVPLLESLHLTGGPCAEWGPFFVALADMESCYFFDKWWVRIEQHLLPNLKSFKLKGKYFFPWNCLYGLLFHYTKPDGTIQRRALEKLTVFVYFENNSAPAPVIRREVLYRMLDLHQTGTLISISVGISSWPGYSWQLSFDKIRQDFDQQLISCAMAAANSPYHFGHFWEAECS